VHNETDIPYVSIHASHEDRLDNHGGYVSRQFSRRYTLPPDVDANNVKCDLSNSGILTMQAPKRSQAIDEGGARSIPITMVDKPAKLTHAGEPNEEQKKK
jgi:HSP20 family molecular chaperone IbpA